jgi:argininosuccinate lyase
MTAALGGIEVDAARMHAALSDDLLATEAADALVARGVAFRDAHAAVAAAVARARRLGVVLRALAERPEELPPPLRPTDLQALDAEAAVERRTSAGGTARAAVRTQLDAARALVARQRSGRST